KHILHVYKQLLAMSRRLPSEKEREAALRGVREGFRGNLGVQDQERVGTLLREAESRLGFLKIVTPGRGGRVDGGQTRIVYRGGKALEGAEARRRDRAAHANWSGSNLDPDAVTRHRQTLGRAGFMDHAQVMGPGGF
ncbi:unnamed protein product, partial [Phaeothamnion confervicola]